MDKKIPTQRIRRRDNYDTYKLTTFISMKKKTHQNPVSTLLLIISKFTHQPSVTEREMGKGGENMAAWLVSLNTLKVQPFILPPLGIYSIQLSFYGLLFLVCYTLQYWD